MCPSRRSPRPPNPTGRLAVLGLPATFTLEDLFAAVAQWMGRPLRVRCVPLPPDLSAFWLVVQKATRLVDYFILAADLPVPQRNLAAAHEVGHMLCGHTPSAITAEADLLAALTAPGPLAALARSLQCARRPAEETAAETLATAICLRLVLPTDQQAEAPSADRFRRWLG